MLTRDCEHACIHFKSNQIKSLLLSHHHSTSALVSEILTSIYIAYTSILVTNTHYTPYVHIYIMYTSMHSNM